ncbi:MAG TPA: shikimate dehydrogenase, partial [Candidatus Acidoferrum sp.]|nr:shikimate dehydrogenase [Candidatus Acidoferrum sp.]
KATQTLRQLVPLIVSYHNFVSTSSLEVVKRRLLRVPADAYKIVTTARRPSDNLRVIEFARKGLDSTPLVVFAMSEVGVATRILAPSLGSAYTYAAPENATGTAPGQISSRLMRDLYRCEKLTRHSKIYGVIADPVSHSKSPFLHNRAFQSRRIDAVYLPFLVAPARLPEWMQMAAALPVAGFSVTIPHKQRIVRHLDVVEPLARRIGAVNTVWRKAGKWRGTNTDTDGVLKPLSQRVQLSKASVLIVGYGGAARAAAIALCDAGARVTITGRNAQNAKLLARAIRAESIAIDDSMQGHFDVLLHCTPVGMAPQPDKTLFPDKIPADVVFDMVYNPHETALLKRAASQGRTVIHGSEMLLAQAARQFEIWTGESAPLNVMIKAFELNTSSS